MIIKVTNGNPEIIADVSPVPSWKAKENELGFVQDKPQALIDLHEKYPNGLPADFPGVSSDSKIKTLYISGILDTQFSQINGKQIRQLTISDDIHIRSILQCNIQNINEDNLYPKIINDKRNYDINELTLGQETALLTFIFGSSQIQIKDINILYESW